MLKFNSLGKIANGSNFTSYYGQRFDKFYTIVGGNVYSYKNSYPHKKLDDAKVLTEMDGLLVPINNEQYIIAKKISVDNTFIQRSELTQVNFSTEFGVNMTINDQKFKLSNGKFNLSAEYFYCLYPTRLIAYEPTDDDKLRNAFTCELVPSTLTITQHDQFLEQCKQFKEYTLKCTPNDDCFRLIKDIPKMLTDLIAFVEASRKHYEANNGDLKK